MRRYLLQAVIAFTACGAIAQGQLTIFKSGEAPQGSDLLLGFDVEAGQEDLLLWDRGTDKETFYGQTFRFDTPTVIDKITLKVQESSTGIGGERVELRVGTAANHPTDSHLTSLLLSPIATLPVGLGSDAWYLTMDFSDVVLEPAVDYGFTLRFADGGPNGKEAFLWATGENSYEEGTAFRQLTTPPGGITLPSNDLVFFVHGDTACDVGDFNCDEQVNAQDIDLLSAAILAGKTNSWYDLNEDGNVDIADHATLVSDIVGTLPGDADLNQHVAFADFLTLSANFGLEGGWSQGDFDGNAMVQFDDFLLLSEYFGATVVGPVASVPEPSTLSHVLAGLICVVALKKRRMRTTM